MIFRSLVAMYWFPRAASVMLAMLRRNDNRPSAFVHEYWHTADFTSQPAAIARSDNGLRLVLKYGMLAQAAIGVLFIVLWKANGLLAGELFGAALLVSYPLIWAHLLAIYAVADTAGYLFLHPKRLGRALVCRQLESQVRRLRKRHDFKIVAVAGSVGKTSTKLAIAELLTQKYRVRHQVGNYNDRVTVPLILFGQHEPSILNVFTWLRIFRANARALKRPYPYEVVVVELGTDGPGFMREFAYLKPDITVVTAITEEHMEYFKTLEAVAAEELKVFDFSNTVLVNGDDIPGKYLAGREFTEYSTSSQQAAYYTKPTSESLEGQMLDITLPEGRVTAAKVKYIGWHGAKFALAAAAVGDMIGMKPNEIKKGLERLEHFAGRMQVLPGQKGTVLIDDTYNASPVAVKAALDVLYAAKSKQRIAILGSMNELGDYSPKAHREVGEYCDPKKLASVVTIGHDAERYLAPAARKKGCVVTSFLSPYEAGDFVQRELKEGAIVLAKGSQNGVFAEEALKSLLVTQKDAQKLVRQSSYWLKRKAKQFNG